MNTHLNHILTQQLTANLPHAAEPRRLASAADAAGRGSRDATSGQASVIAPADTLVLADGTQVRLRPLGSADRDGLAALFARLSPESRYRRFLSPKPSLTARELVYLTDIDRFHHEAVAAVDPRDGSIIGVGRYIRFADRPNVADVGFEVADELQGIGIGAALATHIVEHARANGITLLTASTLWDNRPARAILRGLGFRACASEGSVIELELALDVPTGGARRQAPNPALRRQTTTGAPAEGTPSR